MSKKKTIKNIIKIVVTGLGLYLAYRQIDPRLLNTNWSDYNFWLFGLAAVMSIGSLIFTSSRLYIILRRKIPLKLILKADFIGSFFNVFLPSTIGGDVVKISKVSSYSGSLRNSTVSVILDRLFGIIALIILSAIFTIFGIITNTVQLPNYILYFMIALLVGVAIFFILLFKLNLSKFDRKVIPIKFLNFKKELNIGKWIKSIYEIREIPVRDLLLVLLISFLYHFNGALIAYVGLTFLHVDIAVSYVILFRSISTILLMLPISISGLGVRDFVFKELYGSVTDSPQVLLLAPLMFILICTIALVGGVVFLFDKQIKKD